jgi:four helix bundle protein
MKTRQQYPFERLRAWQAARALAKETYLTTSKFPQREVYGLTSQCNRAAVSVAANLAEDSSRRSRKDQARFSEIAYGSLMLILSNDVDILPSDSEQILRDSIERLSSQLNALHHSQRARID